MMGIHTLVFGDFPAWLDQGSCCLIFATAITGTVLESKNGGFLGAMEFPPK